MDLPSLNLLRTFDAVGRRKSLRVAADELRLTESAVTQDIRDLEEQLGLSLFVRQPPQISFTPEGAHYHQAVAAAFADLRTATQELLAPASSSPLRFHAIPYVATEVVGPMLGDFLNDWPGVRVELEGHRRTPDLQTGEADVSIRYGFNIPDQAIPLARTSCTLVCGPSILSEVRADPPGAFERFPAYSMAGYADLWQRWTEAQEWDVTPTELITLNRYRELLVAASRGGLTLGLLPIITPMLESGELVVPFPDRIIPLGALSLSVRDAVRYRPEVVALVPWLRKLFQGYVQRTDEFFSSLAVK
ncbi:LysR substrate-binding domain-containing protein [Marinobacter nanhaiticus D15-8W]|uniref:LysR family transcriptional regulator n=1 Tax=Marinobacter nanhaiticus D15-8W TaxID=626887 RepID=N6VYP8_9GAMM|nr:LysR family transcriptional regulator [Marinobacter nanhaiticus]ENO12994.1 LysR family transcriptional regulator [Marinobacter nanhaiticus D15-8W]BES70348.1 LysR substrate-binding domain-containing protein [Marinobacter nanhaiticus D15-8W]